MRLWHYQLLPYLPDLQFKGQLRELVAIMRQWRDNGKTNHLLVNRAMEYPKHEFVRYFLKYEAQYRLRYDRWLSDSWREFRDFGAVFFTENEVLFEGWHNTEYLRVCMANLYEKHFFGIGNSRITDEEWKTLCRGYKEITGEEYKI